MYNVGDYVMAQKVLCGEYTVGNIYWVIEVDRELDPILIDDLFERDGWPTKLIGGYFSKITLSEEEVMIAILQGKLKK